MPLEQIFKFLPILEVIFNLKVLYCIRSLFGGDFNLAV